MNSSFNFFNLVTVLYVKVRETWCIEAEAGLRWIKDPGSIEGVAGERKHVLSCWNLNRGHGRLFDRNPRPLENKQHHHFFLSLPPLFILHRFFQPQPFHFAHSIVRKRPLPSQRLNHALGEVNGGITRELAKVGSTEFMVVVTYVRWPIFSCFLANGLQSSLPSLKNGVRMSLDLKGFRFDCEWQPGDPGLYRWCPCFPLELAFRRNVSTLQQGQQEIALEVSNLC